MQNCVQKTIFKYKFMRRKLVVKSNIFGGDLPYGTQSTQNINNLFNFIRVFWGKHSNKIKVRRIIISLCIFPLFSVEFVSAFIHVNPFANRMSEKLSLTSNNYARLFSSLAILSRSFLISTNPNEQ